jgi:5'-deoxynucleotidase YfbR-like HD superfamily hydrolase
MAKPSGRTAKPPRAWQRMLSGRRLDLLDPSPLDVEIEDIAHGLARVARWNGQTRGDHAFSVAQHSVLVEAILGHVAPAAGAQLRLMALLHDAPEYVIGDIISPFKAAVGETYKVIEKRLMAAIHLRFSLPPQAAAPAAALIKRADRLAAFHEAVTLAGFQREEALKFFGAPEPLPRDVLALTHPLPAPQAQAQFLARFAALERG